MGVSMLDMQGCLSALHLGAYSEVLTVGRKGGGGIVREPVCGTFWVQLGHGGCVVCRSRQVGHGSACPSLQGAH